MKGSIAFKVVTCSDSALRWYRIHDIRFIFSIFQIQELKILFENMSNSCTKARGMKCCNNSFLVWPTAGKPLMWPSITFQKAE